MIFTISQDFSLMKYIVNEKIKRDKTTTNKIRINRH